MDYRRRQSGLHERMAEGGLGLVAYGPAADFQYLTGLLLDWRSGADASWSAATVFVPAHAAPILVLPEACAHLAAETWINDVRILKDDPDLDVLIRSVLGDAEAAAGGIAVGRAVSERMRRSLQSQAGGVEFCDARGLTEHLRMVKDPGEVERLRRVARLTDEVLAAVIPRIREGVTQLDLEAEIESQGRRLGASGPSFPPRAIFTKSGSEPAPEPFTYPPEEGLAAGTSIAFDFGFVMNGYCSDFGRSLYFGDAPGDVSGAYEALQQGVVETVAGMRDGGMRLCDLFPALEKTLDGLGCGDYLRARLPDGVLGHNIGIEVHENPWLRPDCGQRLRANMVMALEPKLWRAGEYYLRVEDMVLVGEDGAEFLTRFDRTTFQL